MMSIPLFRRFILGLAHVSLGLWMFCSVVSCIGLVWGFVFLGKGEFIQFASWSTTDPFPSLSVLATTLFSAAGGIGTVLYLTNRHRAGFVATSISAMALFGNMGVITLIEGGWFGAAWAAVIGIGLIWMWRYYGESLRFSEATGGPVCQTCGYRLCGLRSMRCPECGESILVTPDLAITKKKRWWRRGP